mmetsp:Transcript_25190/g.58567  ORF Transcript_25190/g.58567 Transcript_25190/m.58567 type:complete len:120 (+) Transcript_25190:108-467(+)
MFSSFFLSSASASWMVDSAPRDSSVAIAMSSCWSLWTLVVVCDKSEIQTRDPKPDTESREMEVRSRRHDDNRFHHRDLHNEIFRASGLYWNTLNHEFILAKLVCGVGVCGQKKTRETKR